MRCNLKKILIQKSILGVNVMLFTKHQSDNFLTSLRIRTIERAVLIAIALHIKIISNSLQILHYFFYNFYIFRQ